MRERLSEYLDKRLDARSEAAVRRHVEACDACRQELAALKQTVTLLREMPMAPAPRSFLLTRAQAGQPVRAPWLRTPLVWQVATSLATLFLAVMLVGDYFGGLGNGVPVSPAATPAPVTVATAQPTPVDTVVAPTLEPTSAATLEPTAKPQDKATRAPAVPGIAVIEPDPTPADLLPAVAAVGPTPPPVGPTEEPSAPAPDTSVPETLTGPSEQARVAERSLSLVPWEIALGCVVAVLGAIALIMGRRARVMVGKRRY